MYVISLLSNQLKGIHLPSSNNINWRSPADESVILIEVIFASPVSLHDQSFLLKLSYRDCTEHFIVLQAQQLRTCWNFLSTEWDPSSQIELFAIQIRELLCSMNHFTCCSGDVIWKSQKIIYAVDTIFFDTNSNINNHFVK